jgi:hypothetical protein
MDSRHLRLRPVLPALLMPFALLTLLPACGKKEAPKADAKSPWAVTLLEPGAKPRSLLAYDLKGWKGGTAEMEMTVAMGAMSPPPTQTVVRYDRAEETADGDLRVAFAVERTTMGGKEVPKSTGLDMKGFTVFSPAGRIRDVQVELPENAPPMVKQVVQSLRDSMRRAVMPVPDEPVGIGGRWEMFVPVEVMGLQMTSTATYRLEERTGEKGTIHVDMVFQGSGELKAPGTSEAVGKLESMQGKGSGTLKFDLRSPIAALDLDMELNMRLAIGKTEPMSQSMKMKMTLKPGT